MAAFDAGSFPRGSLLETNLQARVLGSFIRDEV